VKHLSFRKLEDFRRERLSPIMDANNAENARRKASGFEVLSLAEGIEQLRRQRLALGEPMPVMRSVGFPITETETEMPSSVEFVRGFGTLPEGYTVCPCISDLAMRWNGPLDGEVEVGNEWLKVCPFETLFPWPVEKLREDIDRDTVWFRRVK
jgi:hypothetical protein